ncbi:MAG TPA: hypothetical protein VHD90_19795 [Phototrophicaceae bacterium]|nr:hypothetical protein [Phototrophicaceae bacterium]
MYSPSEAKIAYGTFIALLANFNNACESGDLEALDQAETALRAIGATVQISDGLELWQPPAVVPRVSFDGWSNPPRDDGLTWLVFDYQLEINGRIIDRSNDFDQQLDFARWSTNNTFDPHGLLRIWRIRRLADGAILAEFRRPTVKQ